MDLSRRDFFRRMGSKSMRWKWLGAVWLSFDDVFHLGQGSGVSVEQAGRALRNKRSKPPPKLTSNTLSTTPPHQSCSNDQEDKTQDVG